MTKPDHKAVDWYSIDKAFTRGQLILGYRALVSKEMIADSGISARTLAEMAADGVVSTFERAIQEERDDVS